MGKRQFQMIGSNAQIDIDCGNKNPPLQFGAGEGTRGDTSDYSLMITS
jgi:hypothetical protein